MNLLSLAAMLVSLMLPQECSPRGWTLAYEENDTTYYLAEGPFQAWITDGWTDSEGARWWIDTRLYAEETPYFIMWLTMPDGRKERATLKEIEGYCLFKSNPLEDDDFFMLFGVQVQFENHYHPHIESLGKTKVPRLKRT